MSEFVVPHTSHLGELVTLLAHCVIRDGATRKHSGHEPSTREQRQVLALCLQLFRKAGWTPTKRSWRQMSKLINAKGSPGFPLGIRNATNALEGRNPQGRVKLVV